MSKLFFYDCETTGVNYYEHGIHQISGAIVIDGEIKERFNFKVKPYPQDKIDDRALEIGHTTYEEVMLYPEPHVVYSELLGILSKYVDKYNKLDKMHLVGYNNAAFDDKFLRAFFEKMGDVYFGSWFWAGSIDVYVLASFILQDERNTFINFKQGTVAQKLGIEVDDTKLHDAQYDIDICMNIYNMLMERIVNPNNNS